MPKRIQRKRTKGWRTARTVKPRRVWKTWYIESGRDYHELESVWQSWPRSSRRHQMNFKGAGMIQTNVPFADLREIFRTADARWVDCVSDTKPDTDEGGGE